MRACCLTFNIGVWHTRSAVCKLASMTNAHRDVGLMFGVPKKPHLLPDFHSIAMLAFPWHTGLAWTPGDSVTAIYISKRGRNEQTQVVLE